MPRRSKGARLYLRERKGREAQYAILDGPREVSTGCGPENVAGANQALADYLADHFRPNTGERDLARITCAEVLTMYAQDQPADKPSLKLIGYHMKALLPFWGMKSLADVKGSTCRRYTLTRSATPNGSATSNIISPPSPTLSRKSVTPSTVRRELKTLQAAINHWHRESPLAAVPKVSLPPEGARRERVLERSEVARLLWAARKLKLNHVARFILIGVYTGTRHDAILHLRWTPALTGGHIVIDRSIIFRRGASERKRKGNFAPLPYPRPFPVRP